jgi:RNase H-fold protein (predicted Holliday junction resolvase)
MKHLTILSVDLGRTVGVAVAKGGKIVHEQEHKIKSLKGFADIILVLLKKYKPHLIIIPYPTRFYSVIVYQAKMMGVVNYLAELNDTQTIECNDARSKKLVLNKGKATKEDICKFYPDSISEHTADARLFIDAYLIETDCPPIQQPNLQR